MSDSSSLSSFVPNKLFFFRANFFGAHYKLITFDKKCVLIFLKIQKCLCPTPKLKATFASAHMGFEMHEKKCGIPFLTKIDPLKHITVKKLDPQGEMNMLWNFCFLMIIDALTIKIQFYASLCGMKGSSSLTMQLTPCFVSFEVQIIG